MNKLLALAALLCTVSFTAFGADRACAFTVVFESYPPYEFYQGTELVGIDVDIVREAASRLGKEVTFEERPWKRAMDEVREGQVDAIISLFKTDERQEFLYFPTENLSVEKVVIMANPDNPVSIGKLEDLRAHSIGVLPDYAYGEAFDSMEGLNKDVSNDNVSLIRKLVKGRTDVIVGNELVLKDLARSEGLAGKIETAYTLDEGKMYIGFSKARGEQAKALAEGFSKVLAEMRADGTIDRIMSKY